MTNKHDSLISELESIVREGTMRLKNEVYKSGSCDLGEVDFAVYNNGVLWVYEVKSNNTIKLHNKGIKQLKKHNKYFLKHLLYNYGVIPRRVHYYLITPQQRGINFYKVRF